MSANEDHAKWNLIVDVALCNGCYNCFMAAKDEYVGNDAPGYFAAQPSAGHQWIAVEHIERGQVPVTQVSYLPKMCNHCDDAPCLKAATNGAVTKRADGIVLIDPVKAKGQQQIVAACPYGAVFWNEEAQLPQAWPFDAHLLDTGWKRPRCEQVCATGAITSAKISDQAMRTRASAEGLEPLRADFGTRPRVWYRNLARIRDIFIAGSLETERDGVADCLAGAEIRLMRDGQMLARTVSDDFGDFRLDGISAEGATAQVVIDVAGNAVHTRDVLLDEARYLGRIRL